MSMHIACNGFSSDQRIKKNAPNEDFVVSSKIEN